MLLFFLCGCAKMLRLLRSIILSNACVSLHFIVFGLNPRRQDEESIKFMDTRNIVPLAFLNTSHGVRLRLLDNRSSKSPLKPRHPEIRPQRLEEPAHAKSDQHETEVPQPLEADERENYAACQRERQPHNERTPVVVGCISYDNFLHRSKYSRTTSFSPSLK